MLKQKTYCDQKTHKMNLQTGDKVLLLLPSSTNKFVAQWQGPYTVTKRTGKVNYEIQMPDKGNRKQVFHVNYLRKLQEWTCEVNAVIISVSERRDWQTTVKVSRSEDEHLD